MDQASKAGGVTRLAPSPTGALHVGNARTFLANWLMVRGAGWKVILRIEDLDGPRVKRAADAAAIEDLSWLGLDWDAGPIYQSGRGEVYRAATERLMKQGLAYACTCSRRDVQSAGSAPHGSEGAVYPGTCRGKYSSIEDAQRKSGRAAAVRLAVGDEVVEFEDCFAGTRRIDVGRELGDCVIMKADGSAAYQLAVVVDDAAEDVNQVVRGDDLIASTAWQILIYKALGLSGRIPTYTHLPLVVGADGKRLAKRHGDSRLARYREMGMRAERIVGMLGRWLGIEVSGDASAAELVGRFDLSRVDRRAMAFDEGELF